MLQQMAVLQAVPRRGRRRRRSRCARCGAGSPRCCRPTRRSCSTASCLHGRAELGLAPDEYSGLVMVLLRLLAFTPAADGAQPNARARAGTRRAAPSIAARRGRRPARAGRLAAQAVDAGDVAAPADAADAARRSPRRRRPRACAVAARRRPADARESTVAAATPTVGERWALRCSALIEAGAIAALVRELALQAQCLAIDDDAAASVWRLRVEREIAARAGAGAEAAGGARGLLDRPVRARDRGRRRRATRRRCATPPSARGASRGRADDPRRPVRAGMMAQYKTARIVPGSVKPHRAVTSRH